MRPSRRRSLSGFTLVELMITIAIIGVLAAVAIPSYIHYLRSARSSEAFTVLSGIVGAQMAFFANEKTYADLPWMPYERPADPSDPDICKQNHFWEATHPNFPAWQNVFVSGGPTWHTYRSYTNNAPTRDRTPPDTPGTTWPENSSGSRMKDNWFVAQAWGNVDCDSTPVLFWISSGSQGAYKTLEDEVSPGEDAY